MQPYESDEIDSKKGGESGIIEFPGSMHIMYLLKEQRIYRKFFGKVRRMKKEKVITIYFHIFELIDYLTGPNDRANIDKMTLNKMYNFLEDLNNIENIKFMTINELRLKVIDKE